MLGRIGSLQPVLQAAGLVRKSFRPLVLYGAALYLIAGGLLAPLLLWVLAEVLSLAHSDVIVNYDVAALAFSLNGILLGFLWALVFCSLAVVILGGGVLLIAGAHTGRNIPLRRLVRRSVALVHRVPDDSRPVGLGAAPLDHDPDLGHGPREIDALFDPILNLKLGTAYLRQLLNHYHGNVETALAAYNWGPGHIDRRSARGVSLPRLYPQLVRDALERRVAQRS